MQQQEEKITAQQRILRFMSKYAKIFGSCLIGILLFFVIFEIFNFANNKEIEKSTLLIEDIQERYQAFIGSEEKSDISAVTKFIDELDGVIEKYPKRYAGRRALFMKGDIFYKFEDFEKAAESFALFAEKFPKSYLAPICIYNTGVCYENLDRIDEAKKEYQRIYDNYKGEYAFMPKVLFSLGRIAETGKNYADAEKYYDLIAEEFPESSYSLYAQDRIILMKAKSLI